MFFLFFFVLTSTIHADVSVSEIITAEKMYDLHFTDAERFYGDPNEHQPEVLQIPA
jgi:hypothetical protein